MGTLCGFSQGAAYQVGGHVCAIRGTGMDIAGRINVLDDFSRGGSNGLFVRLLVAQRLLYTGRAYGSRGNPKQRDTSIRAVASRIERDGRRCADQREIAVPTGYFHERPARARWKRREIDLAEQIIGAK